MRQHKLETALVAALELCLGVTIGKKWTALTDHYALVLFVLLGAAMIVVWYWSHLVKAEPQATSMALRYLCTAVFVLNIAIYRLLS